MKKILLQVTPWQARGAITWDGDLHNIFFSSPTQTSLERVYFKGKVTKILPGIQTAFVDIGQERAGFLHISEIDRDLALSKFSESVSLDDDAPKKRRAPSSKADISKIFREGEDILVQVSKEPVYEKGAKLTTCFTLPGRFIVLMPNIPRVGISKKIESREERARLKEIVQKALPEGMGAIIRTTSEGRPEKEIAQDVAFLSSIWATIQKKLQSAQTGERIYEDLAITEQIVRDHLDADVEAVITDDPETHKEIYRFVNKMAPEYSQKIKLYRGKTDLFDYYQIEKQITQALERKVALKSGGSLIIETTEAMTVVDVNTGKFVGKSNMEETILKTNMEAAEEIVRQLKLRNIGGLIVIDFIDLSMASNKQKLFNFFDRTLKEQDKFQSVVLKISEFGLVQMTRKRSGKTLMQQLLKTCECCKGLGMVTSLETECYAILREIRETLNKGAYPKDMTIYVHPQIFDRLVNVEYNAVLALEKMFTIKITMASDNNFARPQYKIIKT